jgi:hypothetical protein
MIKNFNGALHYYHEEAGTDNSATASLDISEEQSLKLFFVFVFKISRV